MTTRAGKLEKAYLAVVAPPTPATKPPRLSEVLGKARSGGEGEIVFTFNPNQFSISKSAGWSRVPQRTATSSAMPQFTGSEPAILTLEVFFDASEAQTPRVAADVQRLLDCVRPLRQTIASDEPSPPLVVFGWGRFTSFVAIVKQVNANYTMFRPDGTPTRATATITLEEIPTDPPPRQNPTSGALAAHRVHQVVAGDSLASIAYEEYGDATLWRRIAELNDIDDPMRVPPGRPLLVPSARALADEEAEQS
jgi:nucleoid-associated protein YgaU